MGLRDIIFPPKRDFFAMLLDQSAKTEQGMEALVRFIYEPTPENGRRVDDLEKEADELRRILIDELNRAFVTPMDREDIFSLSRAVDDVIDYAKTSVEEILLFRIQTNGYLQKIAEALHNASREIRMAIERLRKHPQACAEHITRAKKAENFVEHRYREALAELFYSEDVRYILKMREIYRHLSNAADRCDEAANIIGDILVKMT